MIVPVASETNSKLKRAATVRLRRHQRTVLLTGPTGRATTGRPSRKLVKSSARSLAVRYLLCGSLLRHFRQIVSKSLRHLRVQYAR